MWCGLNIQWKHKCPLDDTPETLSCLPRHGKYLSCQCPRGDETLKAFYFQRSECRNENLTLTSRLGVSCCSTWISEHREWGASFFDTLSFGWGHCHPMPMSLFMAPFKTSFSAFQSLCPTAAGLLTPPLCVVLLFNPRGFLLSTWLVLRSSS